MRGLARSAVVVLCAGLVGGAGLGSQSLPPADGRVPPPVFTDAQRVAKLEAAFPDIDRLFRAFAERSRVPGIAYGILIDGRLAHFGAAGYRDAGTKDPVDADTVFRIASMTKSFTALCIMRLRDDGKLSLDDPAERYVPELAGLAIRLPIRRASRSGTCCRTPRDSPRTIPGATASLRPPTPGWPR